LDGVIHACFCSKSKISLSLEELNENLFFIDFILIFGGHFTQFYPTRKSHIKEDLEKNYIVQI